MSHSLFLFVFGFGSLMIVVVDAKYPNLQISFQLLDHIV